MKNYFGIILRTWKILKPFHKDFYFQLFFIFLGEGVGLALTYLISKLIDALIGKNILLIVYLLVAYPVLRIIQTAGMYISGSHYMKRMNQGVQQYLQEFSFKKILSLNISQYIEDHSAIKKEITDKGEGALYGVVASMFLDVFPIIVSIFLSIIVISFYVPLIGLWCFGSLFILVFWVGLLQIISGLLYSKIGIIG